MEILYGPWLALAPLAALVVVLLWPYAGRLKLANARARLRKASARAASLRARGVARARQATVHRQQQEAMAAQEALRRLEAARAENRARWQDREPAVNGAIDVINILLAQNGSLSLDRGLVQHAQGSEYGVRCTIIAHDRPNGYIGSLLLQIDRDHFICTLQWPGHQTSPCVRDVAAGMAVADIADLIAEALRLLTSAAAAGAVPRPRPAQDLAQQRGFA